MNIVKVKDKYQVTIPTSVRKKVGIEVGDILEIKAERDGVVLSLQSVISKRLAHAIQEVESGQTHGPFKSARELFASLDNSSRKRTKKR